MAALGRWLGIFGWLWFIAGFVAPALDIADIEFFPGLILVFLGRLLRRQARRQETDQEPQPASTSPLPRPLNTERTQPEPAPQPAVAPEVRTPPILVTPTPPPPVVTERAEEPKEEMVEEKLFSKTRSATPARTEDEAVLDIDMIVEDAAEKKVLTSEEMIARARERWDRRG